MSSVVAVIRASALQQNLATVRRCAPGCAVMAVIKANAYGHGLVAVARILNGVDALAVARMREAIELREGGVDSIVVCLSGFTDVDELKLAREYRVQLVIHARHQIDLLEQAAPGVALPAWLKIDSGMGRLGISSDEGRAAFQRLSACPAVSPGIGLMTHLACADDLGSDATGKQIDILGRAAGDWEGDVSVANSAGIMGWPDSIRPSASLSYTGRSWVRPGLMLYGVSPFADRSASELGLRPAMSLQAPVISVRRLKAGQTVGYGATWRADRDSLIAVLAAGYGDGMPWRAAAGSAVVINGSSAPIVGRVSMDLLTADVTDLEDVRPGDTAVLWGDDIPVEAVAECAGTIPYELLTSVTSRVKRDYVD